MGRTVYATVDSLQSCTMGPWWSGTSKPTFLIQNKYEFNFTNDDPDEVFVEPETTPYPDIPAILPKIDMEEHYDRPTLALNK